MQKRMTYSKFLFFVNSISQTIRTLVLNKISILAVSSILIVINLGVNLLFLTSSPLVFIDEPWYANAAWNWLRTGDNFDTIHAGTYDQYGFEWLRWPLLGNLPWLISFSVLGLGLFQARLVSWIFGVILILAVYQTGARYYSKITGALAALLLVMSQPYYQASHYARPDIILAFVGVFVFLLSLEALEKSKWYIHFLTGLIAGLAIDIHPNAVLFIAGIASLYVFILRKRLFQTKGTWLCALGGLIGVGYFVVLHILPNPDVFFKLYNLSIENTHQLPLLSFDPMVLIRSLRDEIGRYHFFENGLDFAMIGASFGCIIFRRSNFDKRLLLFIGVVFLGFILVIGSKHDIYAILLYPFFLLIVAEAFVDLIRKGWAVKNNMAFSVVLLGLVIVSNSFHILRPAIENQGYDYYSITDKIKTVIPSGSRVMGLPNWWFGFANFDYRSSLNLTFYHYLNGFSFNHGIERIHPDYFIVDSGLRALLVDAQFFLDGTGFAMYRLPRQDFTDFLNAQGTLLLQFHDPWHGDIEVYKIAWSR